MVVFSPQIRTFRWPWNPTCWSAFPERLLKNKKIKISLWKDLFVASTHVQRSWIPTFLLLLSPTLRGAAGQWDEVTQWQRGFLNGSDPWFVPHYGNISWCLVYVPIPGSLNLLPMVLASPVGMLQLWLPLSDVMSVQLSGSQAGKSWRPLPCNTNAVVDNLSVEHKQVFCPNL